MRRIYAILLSVMLVLALASAGCAKTAPATAPPAASPKAASETPPAPITFTMFVNHTWFWVDSFGGRPVDDEITKRTGVSLSIVKASDANQMSVLVASGEYPDMFYTYRNANLLTNPQVCYTWPELIKQYDPGFVLSPYELAVNAAPDGNVYTIRNMYFTPEEWADPRSLPSPGLGSIDVRQDMMDKMGLPPIKNLTDFENALIKAKATYPDSTPLLLNMGDIGIQYFYCLFGLDSGFSTNLYADGNKVYYRINHPAYKATLQFLNKLYREGLLSAEMLTYSPEQVKGVLESGKVFASAGFAGSEEQDNSVYQASNVEGTWKLLPIKMTDKATYTDDGAGWAGVFISKKCKDPGRAIKFMEFMKSVEGGRLTNWGIEGVHYNLDSQGYPVWTPEFGEMMKDYENTIKKVGISAWQFAASGKYEGIRNYNPNIPVTLQALKDWKTIYQFKPWFQQIIPEIDTDENNTYTKLKQLDQDTEIQLIVQKTEADFNAKFDELIQKANDMGMSGFQDWLTGRYATVYARYNK